MAFTRLLLLYFLPFANFFCTFTLLRSHIFVVSRAVQVLSSICLINVAWRDYGRTSLSPTTRTVCQQRRLAETVQWYTTDSNVMS